MNTHKVPAPPPAVLLPVARREPERSESDRSATGSKAGPEPSAHPDPEVVAQAKRRTFTADYKQRILAEADQAKGSGGIGALFRREGLYSSVLSTWRRERDAGVRQALAPQKRGPKSKRDPVEEENQQLQKDNARSPSNCARPRSSSIFKKKWPRCWGGRSTRRPGGEAMMDAVLQLAPTVGIESACDALGVARASFYRQPASVRRCPCP